MTYWISIVTEAVIFSIMAQGVNVIWGWAGDFDLALYGYVALGVYLTIVMTTGPALPPTEYILGWHLPYLLAAVVAVVMVLPIAATVGAIARDAGVPGSAPALDGEKLPSDPGALREAIQSAPAVGRISPEGKSAVVGALAE